MQAFLKDDVDGWLSFYETSVPAKKRWGDAEDRLMLGSVPAGRTEEPDPVGDFQLSRGLKVDNIIGPVTRRQLITEYMNEDGVTLPATMEVTKHGCGEHFPLDEAGTELDDDARDGEHDAAWPHGLVSGRRQTGKQQNYGKFQRKPNRLHLRYFRPD